MPASKSPPEPSRRTAKRRPAATVAAVRRRAALKPAALRWELDASRLGFRTTSELEPLTTLPAQDRAIEALRMTSEVTALGYNAFCVGLVGAERLRMVRTALRDACRAGRPAPDRCYVMNFANPEAPRLLGLPRGTARRFAREMEDLVDQLTKHLALVFEDAAFVARIRSVTDEHRTRERALLATLHEKARDAGFAVAQVETEEATTVDLLFRVGHHLVNLSDLEASWLEARAGHPPAFAETPEEGQSLIPVVAGLDLDHVRAAYAELTEVLRQTTLEARRIARSLERQVHSLEREESLVVVDGVVRELSSRWREAPDVVAFLDDVRSDVLDHLALFRRAARTRDAAAGGEIASGEDASVPHEATAAAGRYRVHVLVDHGTGEPCPVVVETNPTSRNLFGSIARQPADGRAAVPPHATLRPGSLLLADGGFLVVDAAEVLAEADAWRRLKRTLLHGRIDLRDAAMEAERSGPAPALRPEPVPITTKVVMLGDEDTYDYLDSIDLDFRHVFRVRAEFDWLMPRTDEACRLIGRYVRRACDEEDLPPFTAAAVCVLAELAGREAEQGERMLSHLDALADPVRQAAWRARRDGADAVDRSHVAAALDAWEKRCSLGAERVREAIGEGRIRIQASGERIGQVNALAVGQTLDHVFGHPVRITAVISRGTGGVLSIEREVQMSGSLHDKGVFVAQGYLSQTYGHDHQLAFSASLAFEQLYGGIDGDSASSALLFALLSALGELPLAQGIAVTGSVNQFGEIQAVGAVNEKIEGFFDACVALAGGAEGLPGGQGVLIPRANVAELMLRSDVVEAVRAGRFHVWAIDDVDEGIALLTGRPAGRRGARGGFPKGSVHAAVQARVEALAEAEEDRGGSAARPAITVDSERRRVRRPKADQ